MPHVRREYEHSEGFSPDEAAGQAPDQTVQGLWEEVHAKEPEADR